MKHKILTLTTTLALFGTFAFADINPKDGTWKSQIDTNNVTGCPSMMKSMISKQSMKPQSKQVDFSEPFHPRSLFEESGQLKWKKLGANKWQAVMQQGGGGMGVNITWSINVVSPTKMKVASKDNMQLPPQMAAMFGGSAECKADTAGSYNYIGN
jgi:hypothetical protein